MAYIIGLVTDEELAKLRAIGWDDEDPPIELKSNSLPEMTTRAFWVDSSVFDVMTGQDWEQQESKEGD